MIENVKKFIWQSLRFAAVFLLMLFFSFIDFVPYLPQILQETKLAQNLKVKEARAAGPAFRAASAKAAGTGAVTPALPTGVAANDIVILVATTIAGGTMTITANGSITTWTALTGSPIDVTGGEKLWVWWGLYSSGSTGPTVTPGSDHSVAATFAYSGANTSAPIDVSATGSEATSDTSFSFATGISSSVNETKAIVVYTSGTDSNTGQGGTPANTSLTTVTLRAEYNTTSGGGGGFVFADGDKATAGTLGTWTDTMVTATPKAYIAFNLKPPANAAPNTPTRDEPLDGANTGTLTPVLKTTATDPNSDDVQYKIEIATNSTFTTGLQTFNQTASQTGWSGQNSGGGTRYTSGTQGVYTVQTALTCGTTYYWRSYAIDPLGTNTWSGTQGTNQTFNSAACGPDATSYDNTSEAGTTLDFSACNNCGGSVSQQITITGTTFGTVSAGSRANCAGGAGTGCMRIADYTIPDANVTAWTDTSITIVIPAAITTLGGSGTTCATAGANGICVTAAGVNDTSGALAFFVYPRITSLSPTASTGAKEGDTITVSGDKFGSSAGTLEFINCGTASATGGTWADGSLTNFTVPAGITDSDDACDVQVTQTGASGKATSTAGTSFGNYVILPQITSYTATSTNAAREYSSSDVDGLVQIEGNHFGTSEGAGDKVEFTGGFGTVLATVHTGSITGSPCTVAGWAAAGTSVCVQVPTGISDSVYTGTVTLTRDTSYSHTGSPTFRVLPRITLLDPSSGMPNDKIKIAGNHLCQTGTCPTTSRNTSNNQVEFGTTQAADTADGDDFFNSGGTPCSTLTTAWNHGEICVAVPTSTPTGNQPIKVTSTDGVIVRTSLATNFTRSSSVPNSPTNLQQFMSAGYPEIAVGGAASSTTIKFEGDISAGTSITMALEIEVKPVATAFNGIQSGTTTPVTGTSYANQSVNISGFSDATQYHWRARTVNTNTYEGSAWVAFGANPSGDGSSDGSPANKDFEVDTTAPSPSSVTATNITDVNADITWNTGEAATRYVGYGTSCAGGASAETVFNNMSSKAGTPDATSTSPHSVTLSGLSANTTYQYKVRAVDSAGNAAYDPSGTTCSNFTTAAAQTRIMKTLDIFIQQATTTTLSSAFPVTFDVFIAESNTGRSNITIRSAFVEVWGISYVTSGNITVGVNFQAGLTPAGNTDYTVSPGAANTPVFWTITKQATGLNWDCTGCTDVSNTLDVTTTGAGVTTSILGARIYVTYNYVP